MSTATRRTKRRRLLDNSSLTTAEDTLSFANRHSRKALTKDSIKSSDSLSRLPPPTSTTTTTTATTAVAQQQSTDADIDEAMAPIVRKYWLRPRRPTDYRQLHLNGLNYRSKKRRSQLPPPPPLISNNGIAVSTKNRSKNNAAASATQPTTSTTTATAIATSTATTTTHVATLTSNHTSAALTTAAAAATTTTTAAAVVTDTQLSGESSDSCTSDNCDLSPPLLHHSTTHSPPPPPPVIAPTPVERMRRRRRASASGGGGDNDEVKRRRYSPRVRREKRGGDTHTHRDGNRDEIESVRQELQLSALKDALSGSVGAHPASTAPHLVSSVYGSLFAASSTNTTKPRRRSIRLMRKAELAATADIREAVLAAARSAANSSVDGGSGAVNGAVNGAVDGCTAPISTNIDSGGNGTNHSTSLRAGFNLNLNTHPSPNDTIPNPLPITAAAAVVATQSTAIPLPTTLYNSGVSSAGTATATAVVPPQSQILLTVPTTQQSSQNYPSIHHSSSQSSNREVIVLSSDSEGDTDVNTTAQRSLQRIHRRPTNLDTAAAAPSGAISALSTTKHSSNSEYSFSQIRNHTSPNNQNNFAIPIFNVSTATKTTPVVLHEPEYEAEDDEDDISTSESDEEDEDSDSDSAEEDEDISMQHTSHGRTHGHAARGRPPQAVAMPGRMVPPTTAGYTSHAARPPPLPTLHNNTQYPLQNITSAHTSTNTTHATPMTTTTSTRNISGISPSDALYASDEKGYIVFQPSLRICHRFRLRKQLGKGTFSRVFEAIDESLATSNVNGDIRPRRVAVKIIRNIYKYQVAAQTELKVLKKLRNNDKTNASCCVHLLEDNYHKGHPVFVFPLYGRSLYGFLVDNQYKPFTSDLIRDFARQIITGVAYIHNLDIVITDLKPENIVLVDDAAMQRRLPNGDIYHSPMDTRIRLIDFGSAVFGRGTKHNHLIQTRHYRAPEVVLKLGWTFSADVWSIGCILIELLYGRMLFNTHDSIDHLNQMITCVGPTPPNMIESMDDETFESYYNTDNTLNLWRAKRSPVQCKHLKWYFGNDMRSQSLLDLVEKMLKWDPTERITPVSALSHPYFNLM